MDPIRCQGGWLSGARTVADLARSDCLTLWCGGCAEGARRLRIGCRTERPRSLQVRDVPVVPAALVAEDCSPNSRRKTQLYKIKRREPQRVARCFGVRRRAGTRGLLPGDAVRVTDATAGAPLPRKRGRSGCPYVAPRPVFQRFRAVAGGVRGNGGYPSLSSGDSRRGSEGDTPAVDVPGGPGVGRWIGRRQPVCH